jgi:hypothetical protein
MGKIAIVIQGASTNVSEQRAAWSQFKEDVIFSTWVGSEHLYQLDDNVIFNKIPTHSGPMNFNYQVESTYNGLLKVKNIGYKRALKIRSDIVPTHSDKFINLINNDLFNFVAWQKHEVHPRCSGYLVDYLMSGDIDDMINLWEIIDNNISPVPEVKLTYNYINKMMKFKNTEVKYILDDLNNDNNLYWIKKGIFLSELQEQYKLHGGFSNEIKYINNDYINFFN